MRQLRLELEPREKWIDELCKTGHIVIKILSVKATPQSTYVEHMVEITSPEFDAEHLSEILMGVEDVKRVDLASIDRDHLVGTVASSDCIVCSLLAGLNCFLGSGFTTAEGKIIWVIYASEESSLKLLFHKLDKEGVSFVVVELSSLILRKDLTVKQENVLKTAFNLGYFDFPRKIRLEKLSMRCGVKPSTLSELLRRAQKNVVRNYLNAG